MKAGIYIHIPFCASKCRYCDFYSVTDRKGQEEYTNMLIREIRSYQGQEIEADSLFFGGGTPSLMESSQLIRLLEACRQVFHLDGEITMEANPDSVSRAYLRELLEAGVNRLSMGAQSSNDRELSYLGRRHDSAGIRQAVEQAREAGFQRISLDVMTGIPFQTPDSLDRTLRDFAGLGVEHLSAYMLKIEEGTPFARENAAQFCPDEDETAEMYLQTVRTLAELGFRQYEISNFSKPGCECQHNLKYWKLAPYLGFGPAAHSCYKGRRFYHPRGLAAYMESGGQNFMEEGIGGDPAERLMLGLRMAEGVIPEKLDFTEKQCRMIRKRALDFQRAGLMEDDPEFFRLTPRGFLVSNGIISDFLALLEKALQ